MNRTSERQSRLGIDPGFTSSRADNRTLAENRGLSQVILPGAWSVGMPFTEVKTDQAGCDGPALPDLGVVRHGAIWTDVRSRLGEDVDKAKRRQVMGMTVNCLHEEKCDAE